MAILFDLDNTLIDRDAALGRLLADLELDDDSRAAVLAAARPPGEADDVARVLSARTGRQWSAEEVAREVTARVVPDDAALAAFAALRVGHRTAIVTNGGVDSQRGKLERGGLPGDVTTLISGELGVEKPEPEIFEAAVRTLGVYAEQTIFVGDDPERDIAAAAAMGMRTCWIARGRPRDVVDATFVVDHISELPALLEASA